MTEKEKALEAWSVYKHEMRDHPRRQLRRRDFVAGYLRGVSAERFHTREVVTPMNLKLYQLIRDLDENPGLAVHLRRTIPETVKRLITFLETGVKPKEQK